MLNYFQTYIWKSFPLKSGWLGDHALYASYWKSILNMCMKWVVSNMSYTLNPFVFSIGIIGSFQLVSLLTFFLYTHICFYICMLTFQIVSISIGIKIFIHIYLWIICAYYISISLSTNFGYAKLDFLNDYYISIDYVSIGILYKLMHHFVWYFIKGEKNLYFTF